MMAQIRLLARRVSKGDAVYRSRVTTMSGERIWATEGRISKGFGRCCALLVVPAPSHKARLAKILGNSGHMSQYYLPLVLGHSSNILKHLLSASMIMTFGLMTASCELTGARKSRIEQALDPSLGITKPGNPQAKLGASEHPKIVAANGGIYSNAKLKKTVEDIAATLVKHSGNPDKRYKITVLNTPSINAFALPGGYLYVTRGLLALATNSAEIAAVLAHEMAHVSANHGIERSRKFEAAKLANRVALDVLTSERVSKVALAANQINLAKFSQNQELQADSLGIKTIGRAGFDAFAAARFLNAMDEYARYQSGLSSNNADQDFLASHPSTPRRIELAKRHARFFGAPGSGIRNKEDYLKNINGILFGDSAQEGYVRGSRFSHSGLGITFNAPSGFKIENNAEAVVISGPGQIAVRFDGISQPRSVNLVTYLNSGWVNGLVSASTRPGKINGLTAAYGEAKADDWNFHITLIRVGTQIYRFILAAPKSTDAAADIARRISGTFRKLTRAEQRGLKPLEVKIVKVRSADSIATLANRMQGVERKLKLFRLINAMKPGDRLKPGQMVKIVVKG